MAWVAPEVWWWDTTSEFFQQARLQQGGARKMPKAWTCLLPFGQDSKSRMRSVFLYVEERKTLGVVLESPYEDDNVWVKRVRGGLSLSPLGVVAKNKPLLLGGALPLFPAVHGHRPLVKIWMTSELEKSDGKLQLQSSSLIAASGNLGQAFSKKVKTVSWILPKKLFHHEMAVSQFS